MTPATFFRNMFGVLTIGNLIVGNVLIAGFCLSVATAIEVSRE
jgi:hypothetical protein